MLIAQNKFFEGLGFIYMPDLSCTGCHKGTDSRYYHIDHFSHSYVIEVADTEEDAHNNCFEDAFLFPDDWDESRIVSEVRDTIVKMCNGEK